MFHTIQKARAREEGFTLIELLVVVIIIGILAAIAIPAFLSQREKAWASSLESDVRNAAMDMEAGYTDTNQYEVAHVDGTNNDTNWTTVDGGDADVTMTVTVSDGTVTAADEAFCLEGSHASLTDAVIYNSVAGGIDDSAGATCPAANAL